ncbi:MAG TPA: universal stress protein [Solirubrobacteraceae bacterium]|nr:universal stress protein [Solirubrobacteraceae bacterium]
MFYNVLVGVDGRQGGRDAIALAQQLAGPGAQLTLAHVDPIERTHGANRNGDSRKMLSDERAGAGVDAKILVLHGPSVADALHQRIASRDCDLLVVGACHRGTVGRRVAGDHTIQSLKDARCGVAVAPQGHDSGARISRIGVGWDGSREAAQALEAARAIAARTAATIEPLLVLPRQSLPYGQPVQHRWSDVAEQLTAEDLARLGGIDGLDGQVSYGSPGEGLARFSEDVDLLIVGSRNAGPVGRLFAGSTSNYLARYAHCPLLVFPASAGKRR